VVNDFNRRHRWSADGLITTDGYLASRMRFLESYGETIRRRGPASEVPSQAVPLQVAPKACPSRGGEDGESRFVCAIATRVCLRTIGGGDRALGMSKGSRSIQPSFVERQNGTDRHRNALKARNVPRFIKYWRLTSQWPYLTSISTISAGRFCILSKITRALWRKRARRWGGRVGRIHVWSMPICLRSLVRHYLAHEAISWTSNILAFVVGRPRASEVARIRP